MSDLLAEEILKGLIPGLPKAQVRMIAAPWFVGQFVMTWAKHERMLIDMLSRIRQVDYEDLRDRLLDSPITEYESEIRKTINALSHNSPAISYLQKVLGEHIRLRKLRHDVVHGFWSAIGPDSEFFLKRKLRKGAETMRTLDLAELADGCKSLDELGISVINASRSFEGKEAI